MNRFDRERWDTMGKEALSRVEELMNSSRINDLLHKREEDEKKKRQTSFDRYLCIHHDRKKANDVPEM